MEAFLLSLSTTVLIMLCFWLEQSGIFCWVVGHKWVADGWEGKRIQTNKDSYVEQRWAYHWHCIRCGKQKDKYHG